METDGGSILDQSPAQSYPSMTSNPKKSGKKIWILVAIVIIAVVSVLIFKPSGNNTSDTNVTPTPTEIVIEPTISEVVETTTTPSPTSAEKAKVGPRIQVQNGSGVEGVASKAQTALKDSGYDSVETGNADNYDYTGTIIKSKDSVLATAKKIKTQLTDYTFDEEIAVLSEDSDFDIIIIVGK